MACPPLELQSRHMPFVKAHFLLHTVQRVDIETGILRRARLKTAVVQHVQHAQHDIFYSRLHFVTGRLYVVL